MELDLKEVLKKISIDIRKAMIKVFNGEDDVEGECEQASIILWKYINDTGLVSSDKNKVALGTFNNHGHYWNIVDDIFVDITIDQFGEYEYGVIGSNIIKDKYAIKEYVDYVDEISLLEASDEFLKHVY